MSDTFDQTYADFSAARRAQIMAHIEAACARVGRDVSEVSPVAVSKTVGTGELLAAWPLCREPPAGAHPQARLCGADP